MKGLRNFLAGGFLIVGMSGCANQFLTNYQGERFAPVASVKAVSAKPAGVGLIGTSTFVSAASFGEPEAISAAEEVGADFVQWSKGLDAADGPAGAGVVRASLSPTGPVSSWAPVQPGQLLFRYVARFYRRGERDSAQVVDPAPETVGDGEQIRNDDAAATQETSGRAPPGK